VVPAAAAATTVTGGIEAAPAGAPATPPVAETGSPDNKPDRGELAGTPAATPIPLPAQRRAALSQPGQRDRQHGGEPLWDGIAVQAGREPSPLGSVGPETWPSAFEDIIGAALWPKQYVPRLHRHGISDVLAAILSPPSKLAASRPARWARARIDAAPPPDAPVGACEGGNRAPPDWPTKQIEEANSLTVEQRAALEKLKSAVGEGIAIIKATCRDQSALGPAERLRSMQTQLWAVRDAAILIRTPLARFYDSLTGDQKKQFIAEAPPVDPHTQAGANRAAISARDFARMCGAPTANDWPVRQIVQALHPTEAQSVSLEMVHKKSFEMGQLLMASCIQPTQATPAARLDAAIDRLTALIFAASTVGLAFNDFYGQLTNDQKEGFDSFAR
jgi:hypothetical protein